jgi:REP element-mobilizing transposase RayT
MPRRRINFLPGQYFHIYNKAVANDLLFREQENYHFFISRIKEYLVDTADILAFCLLPNHYHLMIQLKNDHLSSSMRNFAMSYAASYNKRYHRVGHLFQGRFQAKIIKSNSYLIHLSGYIHSNPVTAGLVNRAEEWPHSSYQVYLGVDKSDFLKPRMILKMFSSAENVVNGQACNLYKKYVNNWTQIGSADRE